MEKNRNGIEKQDGAHFLKLREDSIDEVVSRFHDNGFVCLSHVISHETIKRWREWGAQHMIDVFEQLHEHKHTPFSDPQRKLDDGKLTSLEYSLGTGIKHGFQEIVMRSPGRYEISVRECKDQPSLVEVQDKMGTVIPAILGEESLSDLILCHVSLVTASPSATDQGWHADGGHTNIQTHMPCHCLNIFIPLVDITIENGPTELRPASHYLTRKLAPMMLAARARKTLRSPVMPTTKCGDVLIFDYRILHRGRANHSLTTDRPILVLTYAKSWFKDICNFPSRSLFDPKLHDDKSKATERNNKR